MDYVHNIVPKMYHTVKDESSDKIDKESDLYDLQAVNDPIVLKRETIVDIVCCKKMSRVVR